MIVITTPGETYRAKRYRAKQHNRAVLFLFFGVIKFLLVYLN